LSLEGFQQMRVGNYLEELAFTRNLILADARDFQRKPKWEYG